MSSLQHRDLFHDIPSEIKSAVGATASHAADQAATLIEDIEKNVPRNCTLGTKRFCITSMNISECVNLPFNISVVLPNFVKELPSSISDVILDQVGALSPLAEGLAKFPTFYVLDTLLSGLVLLTAFTAFAIFSVFKQMSFMLNVIRKLGRGLSVFIVLVFGFLFCIPFALLASFLHGILKKASELPSWVGVRKGTAIDLCYGVLTCASALSVLIALLLALVLCSPNVRAEEKDEN